MSSIASGRRRLGKSQELVVPLELWVGDQSRAREARDDLLEHREPLPHNATLVLHHAGEIASRSRQTGDETRADRVRDPDKHNRNRARLRP